jgi:hypothetical protein
MHADPWGHEALTDRIVDVDPTGPVLEASAALTRLHRELAAAVGESEARHRFDQALRAALGRSPALRPVPMYPAA